MPQFEGIALIGRAMNIKIQIIKKMLNASFIGEGMAESEVAGSADADPAGDKDTVIFVLGGRLPQNGQRSPSTKRA
jgi:hypothetical protein